MTLVIYLFFLQAQNLLLECQCCYDAECVPSKCCNCDNGHIFCNECVINGTNAILGDGDTHIKCFANCGSEFSLSFLQTILAPTTFSILLKKRQAAEVMEAGVEGLVSCPFCHFASIPPENDKIFKCLNPECTKESCRCVFTFKDAWALNIFGNLVLNLTTAYFFKAVYTNLYASINYSGWLLVSEQISLTYKNNNSNGFATIFISLCSLSNKHIFVQLFKRKSITAHFLSWRMLYEFTIQIIVSIFCIKITVFCLSICLIYW